MAAQGANPLLSGRGIRRTDKRKKKKGAGKLTKPYATRPPTKKSVKKKNNKRFGGREKEVKKDEINKVKARTSEGD